MGLVSKATRERIRERIDLVQLVSEYVSLQPRGPDDLWGRCPFHEEKRASFHIRPSRGVFKCFGCSKGGDVFRFIEEIEGVDFKEALKRLAQRAGVPLDEVSPEERAREDHRAELLRTLHQAATFYEDVLWSRTPAGEKGRAALAARGVREDTAKAWRLGCAPDDWGALHQAARERKLSERALLELGLLRRREGGGRPYDFFRDRLMFPIHDDQGRVVGFGGRTLGDDARKYMNSPEVPGVYEKRRVLFGLDKAKKTPKATPRRLIVVEGYLDVVVPHQAGFTNVVASLGTAFTPEQARLARRFFDEVVLLFDGDAAGQAATQRALASLVGESGLTFKVARLPDGLDPDDLVRKDPAALERVVTAADDLVSFLIGEALRGWDAASPAGRERAIKAAIRLLARIEDRILFFTELAKVAERFGLPEDVLREETARAQQEVRAEGARERDRGARPAAPRGARPAAPAAAPAEPGYDAETALLEALLAIPDAAARMAARGLGPQTFEDGPRRRLAEGLFQLAAEGGRLDQPADALGRVEDEGARALCGQLLGRLDPTKDYARVLDGAEALLVRALRRRLQEVTRELRMTKDGSRQAALLAESKRLRDGIEERSRATARAR